MDEEILEPFLRLQRVPSRPIETVSSVREFETQKALELRGVPEMLGPSDGVKKGLSKKLEKKELLRTKKFFFQNPNLSYYSCFELAKFISVGLLRLQASHHVVSTCD